MHMERKITYTTVKSKTNRASSGISQQERYYNNVDYRKWFKDGLAQLISGNMVAQSPHKKNYGIMILLSHLVKNFDPILAAL